MKLIWTDELADRIARSRRPTEAELQATAYLAMAFFLACLALAGLVAWAVRG